MSQTFITFSKSSKCVASNDSLITNYPNSNHLPLENKGLSWNVQHDSCKSNVTPDICFSALKEMPVSQACQIDMSHMITHIDDNHFMGESLVMGCLLI